MIHSLSNHFITNHHPRFVLNGLLNANEIQGEQIFKIEDWKVIGEYVYDEQGGRHQAFYSPLRDVKIKDVHVKAGERVQVEQSLKYSPEEAKLLWRRAGLNEVTRWPASSDAYSEWTFCLILFTVSFCQALIGFMSSSGQVEDGLTYQ